MTCIWGVTHLKSTRVYPVSDPCLHDSTSPSVLPSDSKVNVRGMTTASLCTVSTACGQILSHACCQANLFLTDKITDVKRRACSEVSVKATLLFQNVAH